MTCCRHSGLVHYPTAAGEVECRAPGCTCREPIEGIRIPTLPDWAVLHAEQPGRAEFAPIPDPVVYRPPPDGVPVSTVGVLLIVFMFAGFAIGSCSAPHEPAAMTRTVDTTPWTLPPPAPSPTTPRP